ncbi:MAG: outer membrane protein assembly factor BamD [Chlamydiales bacterium]
MRLLLFFICLCSSSLFASYSHVSGKWSPEKYSPTQSVQEHYDQGYQLLYKNMWDEALIHFMIINYHFQESPFYSDAVFYSGVCYYFQGDFDLANRQFSKYLSLSGKLKHFEKVFEFKYYIADYYQQGRKKHLFRSEYFPKWLPAGESVLEILDEVIASLPGREIAAKALYSKAAFHRKRREYDKSIESLQIITRQFPKHTLAAEAFLEISNIYLEKSHLEAQNPDQIALAQLNLQRFRKGFPSEERLEEAEKNLMQMKEVYGQCLYDVGRFYERKKKHSASAIYYQDAIQKYPASEAAEKSRNRLSQLGSDLSEDVPL